MQEALPKQRFRIVYSQLCAPVGSRLVRAMHGIALLAASGRGHKAQHLERNNLKFAIRAALRSNCCRSNLVVSLSRSK